MIRRVAIVGAGIGAQHLAGYRANAARFRVTTVCDLDTARGQALAAMQPGCGFTPDFGAVLRDPDIDVVDICLPPHLHVEACTSALGAGKITVCEKPLAPSLAEVDGLIALGGVLAPVFQYRYGTGTAQLRALIDAGLAGPCYVGTLETHWDRDAAYYDVPWRGTWAGERGGALLGHAIHIHDLLIWLLGPVAQVFADTATLVNPIETEDCAALAIRMVSGARVTSSVTLGSGAESSRLRLCFRGMTVDSDTAAYCPATAPWTFTARAPVRQGDIDAVLATVAPVPSGYDGLFAALADALDRRGGANVTAADGRASLEFVTACYASARANVPVTLPLDEGHPFYAGWDTAR